MNLWTDYTLGKKFLIDCLRTLDFYYVSASSTCGLFE